MQRVALITGITGQDGAYLARLLLDKGYQVWGGHRRAASLNLWRLEELGVRDQVQMVDFELGEFSNVLRTVARVKPDEIYNLAAQSFVKTSFEQPIYTAEVSAIGVTRLLEAIRESGRPIRFYQAGSSEMFGRVREVPQSESTSFYPRSPYGVAKLYAHWTTVNYREAYGIHACNGILFNHESPLRGLEFVTRKITAELAMIAQGIAAHPLRVGNLESVRDWGFAGDYVLGMWSMLQQESPGDYVLATGEQHTVREFVERAALALGMDLAWEGEAEHEIGRDRKSGRPLVMVDSQFYRPAEVDSLLGSPRKAQELLGWRPRVTFDALVEMMIKADRARAARGPILN